MKRNNWKEVLSWDDSIYNPPDHMDGLRELMKLLDSEGIPFTLIKDPLSYVTEQVIRIKNDKVELTVYYIGDREYAVYKRNWVFTEAKDGYDVKEVLNYIKREL